MSAWRVSSEFGGRFACRQAAFWACVVNLGQLEVLQSCAVRMRFSLECWLQVSSWDETVTPESAMPPKVAAAAGARVRGATKD